MPGNHGRAMAASRKGHGTAAKINTKEINNNVLTER
jgi:hypothetical protein